MPADLKVDEDVLSTSAAGKSRRVARRRGQEGAVLLAFMLVVIVGSSYMLLSRLNEHSRQYVRDTRTQAALQEAKRALIAYAMNYPDLRDNQDKGPGFLPCPAQINDGSPTNCGNAVTTSARTGWLPFQILGFGDLRDGAGERLWYAVSDNFKNTLPDDTVMNPETPGLITVDGSGDVVALIIAPGEPVTGQNSRPSNDEADYLEDDNASAGDGSFVTTGGANFNDKVVTITRQELMQAVQQRVINDVRFALSTYAATYAAYPWLAPFADPKSEFGGFRGSHDGFDDVASLADSTVDFQNDLGVQNGDLVRNITDGSVGTVTGVTANTLTFAGGLSRGTDNDFDTGDEYQILFVLPWTAMAGSNNVLLIDTARDFEELGVVAGDVIDNITDGTRGAVASVSASQITLDAASGVVFDEDDEYALRGSYGQATGAIDSATLDDTDKDFALMGVGAGDMVVNLTDGSVGRVAAVAANSLTLTGLYLGTDNDFDTGDFYYLPRRNTDGASREGLLSVHEFGKHFPTGFSMDWSLTAGNGATVTTTVGAASPHAAYTANLEAAASGTLVGTVAVTSIEGQCVWAAEDQAHCEGFYADPTFPVHGSVTAGTNTQTLTDANADFTTAGVKRGDLILNFDDEVATGITGTMTGGTDDLILEDIGRDFILDGIIPYYHLVWNNDDGNTRAVITEVIDNNTLRVAEFQNGDAVDLDVNDNYTIYTPQLMAVSAVNSANQLVASRLMGDPDFDSAAGGASGTNQEYYVINVGTGLTGTRTIDAGSGGTYLFDAGADFSDVQPGDIIENLVDNAFGLITAVNDATDELWAQLYALDGTARNHNAGEQYRIHYNHDVVFRQFELRPRFAGTASVYAAGNQRNRDLCLGYSADCQTLLGNVAIPDQSVVVTVRDLDGFGNEVARTEIDTSAGVTQGSVRVTGLDYYLREAAGELPDWFLKNHWHQFIYAAMSSEFTAGGDGVCDDGIDCLTIATPYPLAAPATYTDREALVMAAGERLTGANCAAAPQDRAQGRLCDYYEGENSDAVNDDVFVNALFDDSFNDQITVVAP